MDKLLSIFTLERLINSAIIILVAMLLYRILKIFLNRAFKCKKHDKNRNTYISLIYSVIRYSYICIVGLLILQIYGVNIDSMLAGVGILSAVLGLALQDTLKDIIRGVSIISENYLKIGDYVTINGKSGTVTAAGFRSTKIKDDLTGNIITIANRGIQQVEVAANLINLDLPLPYELKLKDAEAIMHEIETACSEIEDVTECSYLGITEFASSSINYRLYAKTKNNRLNARRAINHKILEILEAHKVSIPYDQLQLHQ